MQFTPRAAACSRRAFTLIELLVVIAIIALLAAILFPVFGRARENARRSSCLSNMKQVGLGMFQYIQDYDEVYPAHYNGISGAGRQRWPQLVQPYVKSTQIFNCPSRSDWEFKGDYTTAGTIAYGINYWLNNYYYPTVKLSSIQNPVETVWVGEIRGLVKGADAVNTSAYQCYPSYFGAVDNRSYPTYGFDIPEAPGRLTNRHFDGLNVIWADGHAKWVRREVLESDVGSTALDDEKGAKAGSKYWWGR